MMFEAVVILSQVSKLESYKPGGVFGRIKLALRRGAFLVYLGRRAGVEAEDTLDNCVLRISSDKPVINGL